MVSCRLFFYYCILPVKEETLVQMGGDLVKIITKGMPSVNKLDASVMEARNNLFKKKLYYSLNNNYSSSYFTVSTINLDIKEHPKILGIQ